MLMSVKKQKLVVVGNGMAGIRVLEELIKLAPELYDITVFGAEPHPNYNRIMLSPVLSGEKTYADIVTHDADWYAAQGVDCRFGELPLVSPYAFCLRHGPLCKKRFDHKVDEHAKLRSQMLARGPQ